MILFHGYLKEQILNNFSWVFFFVVIFTFEPEMLGSQSKVQKTQILA